MLILRHFNKVMKTTPKKEKEKEKELQKELD